MIKKKIVKKTSRAVPKVSSEDEVRKVKIAQLKHFVKYYTDLKCKGDTSADFYLKHYEEELKGYEK